MQLAGLEIFSHFFVLKVCCTIWSHDCDFFFGIHSSKETPINYKKNTANIKVPTALLTRSNFVQVWYRRVKITARLACWLSVVLFLLVWIIFLVMSRIEKNHWNIVFSSLLKIGFPITCMQCPPLSLYVTNLFNLDIY